MAIDGQDARVSENTATTQPPGPSGYSNGVLTQITRAMVSIYKDRFGRGPTHARTHYAGPDTVICMLEGTLTPVEQSLVQMGEVRELQNIRQLFQVAAEHTFRAAVEEITGRKTVGFMSGNDITNDLASEIFVLAPEA
jgi:uncharacterized protein YbcI